MTLGQWIMLSYEAPISPTKMISWIVMRWNELMSCKWLATVCVCVVVSFYCFTYSQGCHVHAKIPVLLRHSIWISVKLVKCKLSLSAKKIDTANARLPRVGWACRSRRTWRQSLGFHTSNWWKYIVIKTFEYILFRSNNISHHPITSNQYPICVWSFSLDHRRRRIWDIWNHWDVGCVVWRVLWSLSATESGSVRELPIPAVPKVSVKWLNQCYWLRYHVSRYQTVSESNKGQ